MITINKQPGQKILELGGGNNRHPAADCNVDLRSGPGVDFAANFNEPLPIQSDEWDGVLSIFSIEHVSWRKVKQFVGEIFRILKPGGKAIVITANTKAQIEKVLRTPEEEWGDEESRILFGDQDYAGNFHSVSFSPKYVTKLFQEAGFDKIIVRPYGEINTDLCLEAYKPVSNGVIKVIEKVEKENAKVEALLKPVPETSNPVIQVANPLPYSREELFDRHYFDGGGKVGGYRGMYADFPFHEITFRHVLARRPESVLELGAGRGYLLKRLQDVGIEAKGIDISKHCYMTRAAEAIILADACVTPWLVDGNFDLVLSMSFLEHVPEQFLPAVIGEMERTCKRGLHGINFNAGDGFDRTRVTLHPKEWWVDRLPKTHEVFSTEELERGELPVDYLDARGKIKINAGCAWTQFHWGWQNMDLMDLSQYAQANRYNYQQIDIKRGFPYATGTVDCIYLSHVLEHLAYKEGLIFLRECRRVIKPDGAMRIIVPSMASLAGGYSVLNLIEYDHINGGCAESPTGAGKLWSLLFVGHQSGYDWETLRHYLEEAGFVAHLASFRTTQDKPNFQTIKKETIDMLPCLSLFVDAEPRLV